MLSSKLTDLVRANILDEVDSFLAQQNLDRSHITHWIAHTGGPKVLRDPRRRARSCPRTRSRVRGARCESVGNLSSASVMFILDELLEDRRPQPGDYGMIIGMGPGFSVELVLSNGDFAEVVISLRTYLILLALLVVERIFELDLRAAMRAARSITAQSKSARLITA